MKILVIGSGGREHAIAHKLWLSPQKPSVFVAPGNAGTAKFATNVAISATDIEGLLVYAKSNAIDLTVVGPEQPLVEGIVDVFEEAGLRIFGPNKVASQFEGSKDFTKAFLMRHGIPTADYKTFESAEEAMANVSLYGYPVVIKADGLAAGKGVVIAENEQEANEALNAMMCDQCFGDAGSKVVIERFLKGIEASILCFCDGETILPMAPAQDHKKAFDGDKGLNTGGMGTYCPSLVVDDAMMATIDETILKPFVKGIKKDGISFKGVLFVGLMIDEDIRVLEYNVRFGDPETEVVLPRMENDLVEVFNATLDGCLSDVTLTWRDETTVCVILASGGYPEVYEKGKLIEGLEMLDSKWVYHCGTSLEGEQVFTNGGRVLGVLGRGANLEEARAHAYENVSKIQFDKMQYRTDIGKVNLGV